MSRLGFGHLGINKVNVGPKSVNINVDADQGLELAICILNAVKTQKRFDIAIYPAIVTKGKGKVPAGKIHTTVSSTG
jgi:hypothetical protein